ncbi:MAG: hypothetical protein AB7S38_03195 [Vulcanimicrobiota bacterium]
MHVISLSPRSAAASPPAPQEVKNTAYRPAVDWWEAEGQKFDSTRQLLAQAKIPADGLKASYRFLEQAPPTEKESTLYTGLTGAAAGAAVGLTGAALLGVAGELLGLFTQVVTLGQAGSSGPFLTGQGLAIAAAGGALVGAAAALIGHRKPLPSAEELAGSQSGTIRRETAQDGTTHTVFYRSNDLTRGIDLEDYAQAAEAPAPELPSDDQARRDWATHGALGLGSVAVPLLGLVYPAATGSALGGALDKGKLRGQFLGGALGLAATVGTYAAASRFGWMGYVGGALASAAVGAGVGAAFGPRMEANTAVNPDLAKQWWAPLPD